MRTHGCAVAIAASAGGLEAIAQVLSALPANFPAPVALVQHRRPGGVSSLATFLGKKTALRVRNAADGELVEPGTVYVCPPGLHLTAGRRLQLLKASRLNFVRPSADLLFQSIAHAFGSSGIAVVLSGMGTDGALGAKAVADAGGTVIAQAPVSAEYPQMPAATVEIVPGTRILLPSQMAPALVRLVKRPHVASVLLADDHRIILDGLRALLLGEANLRVVAEAEDGARAVRLAAKHAPDIVVMDVAMPRLGGLAAIRRILAHRPQTRVIALSAHTDAAAVARAMDAGARGFVRKQDAYPTVLTAIRAVLRGGIYLPSGSSVRPSPGTTTTRRTQFKSRPRS
jgi:two-component system chemotaxis response regulator CheB